MDSNCVCVVDDDRDLNTMIEWALGKEGFTVQSYNRPEAFLEALDEGACGCVLLDLKMPGLSGLDVQQIMKEKDIDVPILFLSGYADVPSVKSAFKKGAVDFLEKPIDVRILVETVMNALEISRQQREESRQKAEMSLLIDRLTNREKRDSAKSLPWADLQGDWKSTGYQPPNRGDSSGPYYGKTFHKIIGGSCIVFVFQRIASGWLPGQRLTEHL